MIKTYKIKKFTVIEIIVIIAIVAIVSAIILPMLTKSRENARRAMNLSNLKLISTALTMYATDNNGYLPYADNALNSRSLFLLLPYASNKLEVFYPPHIYDDNMSNETFKQYDSNPETIIPSILAGNTDIEPGYAYSPIDGSNNALQFHKIDPDYPIVSNFNSTYSDDCYVLYSDGSITKLNGDPIE
ncbi:MAG: hypothetical protein GY756_22255 [bacterium]|nr:hypothetical protein [bacterium]